MSKESDENLSVVIFLIGIFIVGLIVGMCVASFVERDRDTQTICDYLHADRQGNVCVLEGKVVFTKK